MWCEIQVRAASPMLSRRAMYAGASSRGYSILAITSAACASSVPGALEAAVSASTRSLRIVPCGAQLVECRERQRSEAADDQLGPWQLLRGIAVRHSHAPKPG